MKKTSTFASSTMTQSRYRKLKTSPIKIETIQSLVKSEMIEQQKKSGDVEKEICEQDKVPENNATESSNSSSNAIPTEASIQDHMDITSLFEGGTNDESSVQTDAFMNVAATSTVGISEQTIELEDVEFVHERSISIDIDDTPESQMNIESMQSLPMEIVYVDDADDIDSMCEESLENNEVKNSTLQNNATESFNSSSNASSNAMPTEASTQVQMDITPSFEEGANDGPSGQTDTFIDDTSESQMNIESMQPLPMKIAYAEDDLYSLIVYDEELNEETEKKEEDTGKLMIMIYRYKKMNRRDLLKFCETDPH